MVQLELAKKNKITTLMKEVSKIEGVDPCVLRQRIVDGKIVILNNKNRHIKRVCGIGLGLKTKINANIGTSTDRAEIKDELKKLEVAIKHGADTVMDLSIAGNLRKIRKEIIKYSSVPVGTVPIYEAAVNAQKKNGSFLRMKAQDLFEVLELQAMDGVDFFTIHAGITQESLKILRENKRLLNIVSRGGAIISAWMSYNKRENPLFEYFDKVLDIAYRYDITLSLGDGLRPGSIFDATDKPQIAELKILSKLAKQAKKKKVQVMIEGPGHIPLNQIKKNVMLQKKICQGAPFYVLGPLVTDVASGYDHISSAIGAALAGSYGADFLCFVTSSEHLRHPSVEDVKEGVIASKIAAHTADLVKGIKTAWDWDKKMSIARRKRDWQKQIKLSIDPGKAQAYRESSIPNLADVCSMCGKYCSIKLMDKCLSI